MSRCGCLCNLLISAILLAWGSIACIEVYTATPQAFETSYPFAIFTFLAGCVTMILALAILSFQLFDTSKDIVTNINDIKHGICCALFLILVIEVMCTASTVVFFKYADIFPAMSSFGGVTLSYTLILSLNNVLILFFLYYCCCYLLFPICFSRSVAHFSALFTVIGFPLMMLSIYSSTSNEYYDELIESLTMTSLISSWLLAFATLFALLAYHIIFKNDYYTYTNLYLGGLFLTFVNICFPYLSLELLLEFIYTNSNIGSATGFATLFQFNKEYASLVLVETFLIFFCGPIVALNGNIIIQYRMEYLVAYSSRNQLLFQSLSIFLEQTLLLGILNTRLHLACPFDDQFSEVLLGLILFGSALIVLHLLTQFLIFRFSDPEDSSVKILTLALALQYLFLILLLVVLVLLNIFNTDQLDSQFQEKQLVFLTVISLSLLLTFPRVLYTNLVIFPKTQNIPELERDIDHEMVQLIKIDFNEVLETVSPEEVKLLEGQECSICLSGLDSSGAISRLKNCGHEFHQNCIKGWLQFRSICPLDRKNVH